VWIGPGHNSIITDDAGQDWIAYHAINVNKPYLQTEIGGDRGVNRVMLIDRIVYRDGWPRIETGMPSNSKTPAPIVRPKR
jgi:arabinan endo-1,5-alpha-L-arabinosidase